MENLNCKCGNPLRAAQSPNDVQLIVYTDREWDHLMDLESIEPWRIPLPAHEVWQCPRCHRIYVFEENSDKVFRTYCLEEN